MRLSAICDSGLFRNRHCEERLPSRNVPASAPAMTNAISQMAMSVLGFRAAVLARFTVERADMCGSCRFGILFVGLA